MFNFFVTAYHVKDYIEHTNDEALKAKVNQMFLKSNDVDMYMCKFLCFKGKHLKLTKNTKKMPDAPTGLRCGPSRIGKAVFGKSAIGHSETMHFYVDGEKINLFGLADIVLQKWQQFFDKHGIA